MCGRTIGTCCQNVDGALLEEICPGHRPVEDKEQTAMFETEKSVGHSSNSNCVRTHRLFTWIQSKTHAAAFAHVSLTVIGFLFPDHFPHAAFRTEPLHLWN